MLLKDKLTILLRRSGIKKTEFAEQLGITYRALANYLNGARSPRKRILNKMAELLSVSPELLSDDKRPLLLSSEELFIIKAESDPKEVERAVAILQASKELFNSDTFTEKDKQSFFSCFTESYFNAKEKKNI